MLGLTAFVVPLLLCEVLVIILLGGNGYIGSEFRRQLTEMDIPFQILSREKGFDYYDVELLTRELESSNANFLINAAGYTGRPNVDACEKDKAACVYGNVVLPGRIEKACRAAGVPWGHVSSGCIFTGGTAPGFVETDKPNFSFRQDNCSFYSGTKALGEEVLADAKESYIWRLRIPFEHRENSRNYLAKLMRYDKLLDATNSVSHLGEYVRVCLELYLNKHPYGIYNVTNPGQVTTREVVEIIKQSGLSKKDFQFFRDEEEFMQTAALAPRSNCILSTQKLESLGVKMTPVKEAIANCLSTWVPSSD